MKTIVFGEFSAEAGESGHALFAAPNLKVGGRKCVPDVAKAFIEGFFGGCLPVVTTNGQAFLPGVIARSFPSMEAQIVNLDHLVKSYDPEGIPRDRIVGSVHAVEYPDEPEGGWVIPASVKEVPLVRAALAICKAAEGVNKLIGSHQTSRKSFTLSLEALWHHDESAWCWRKGAAPVRGAVDLGSGWEGLPWTSSPPELIACFSSEANAVVARWNGREVVHLMGGLAGKVSFTGLALVAHGAEPTAGVRQVLCSRGQPPAMTDSEAASMLEFMSLVAKAAGVPAMPA